MPREKIKLTREKHGQGIRYRKMFKRKTWFSTTFPNHSRRNQSIAWAAFCEWRDERRLELLRADPKADRWQKVIDATKELLKQLKADRNRDDWMFWNDQLTLYRLLATGEKFQGIIVGLDKDYIPINEPDPDDTQSLPLLIVNAPREIYSEPWDDEPEPALPELTGRAVADQYLKTLEGQVNAGERSAGSYSKIRCALDCFLQWFGEERGMDTLAEDDVREYYQYMLNLIKEKEKSQSTISGYWGAWRTFVDNACENDPDIPRPANLRNKSFAISSGGVTIETFTVEECKAFLELATDRIELWLLLMLNCGFYQGDISDLQAAEVDWENGRVIRARSKLSKSKKGKDVPKVNWKLWGRTFELLKEQGSREGRVFSVTGGKNAGEPLVASWIKPDGNESKRDAIKSSWKHLVDKAKRHEAVPKDWHKNLKQFRKTSASMIETSDHAEFVDEFLDHTRISKKHYTKPGQVVPKFDEAIVWLGEQFGLDT